jgi:hypothetical protein
MGPSLPLPQETSVSAASVAVVLFGQSALMANSPSLQVTLQV